MQNTYLLLDSGDHGKTDPLATPIVRAALRHASLAAILLLSAADASALLNDTVELFAAGTVTQDSNVFRLSDDVDPNTVLGSSQKSDTIIRTEVGANFNLPFSRQRFVASLSGNRTHYNHHSDLDFTGRAARGAWLWELGDQLKGELGYSETKSLASFSDIQNRTVNPLTTRRTFGNASYLITPRWQLQASLGQTDRENDHASRKVNNAELRDGEFGIHYISPAANKIGLSLRQVDGHLPNRQLVLGNPYGNDYRQRSLGLVTDWTISVKSRLTARVDRAERNYDELNQRDWSGTLALVNYDWRASENLTLTARAQRDISMAEDIQTYFVLVKGVSLRTTLALGPKTQIAAVLDRSNRDYLGNASTILGTAMRSDTVGTVGLTWSHVPIPKLTLRLSAQRETRSSNIAFADYKTNIVSFSLNYAF
jgi:exopolysaccharide biosynthesis operon protein EpsL